LVYKNYKKTHIKEWYKFVLSASNSLYKSLSKKFSNINWRYFIRINIPSSSYRCLHQVWLFLSRNLTTFFDWGSRKTQPRKKFLRPGRHFYLLNTVSFTRIKLNVGIFKNLIWQSWIYKKFSTHLDKKLTNGRSMSGTSGTINLIH